MGDLSFLIVMSLSGSIIVLLYYLFFPLIRWKFQPSWKRKILRISIIFYLLPIPYLKFFILSLFVNTFRLIPRFYKTAGNLNLDQKRVIYFNHDIVVLSKYELIYIMIGIMCAIFAAAIVTIEFIKFVKARNVLIKYSHSASEKEDQYFEYLKKKLHISRKITLLKSSYISIPMIMGIYNPVVLMPEELPLIDKEKEGIIIHELSHIKNWDTLWHVLGLIMITLHCFNPISYLAYYSLNELDELCSDEAVVLKYNREEKLEYCNTIIAVSSGFKIKEYSIAVSGFNGRTKHRTKRRLDEIMNGQRKNKAAAVLLGSAALLSALGVILVYKPPLVIYAQENDGIYSERDREFFEDDSIEGEVAALCFGDSFIDSDNQVFPVPSIEQKVPCLHSYVNGTRKKHTKNKDGSCTTKYYKAKRCIYCGRIESGALDHTDTYTKCPH